MRYLVSLLVLFVAIGSFCLAPGAAQWVEYPSNPVYTSLPRAYYPSVLYDDELGYRMWYTSDSYGPTALANSTNGIDWTFVANCTGLKTANHVVVIRNSADIYEMWYWDTTAVGTPYNNATIRHAYSVDGINWTNDTAITQDPYQPLINSVSGTWNRGSYGPCFVLYFPNITALDTVNITNNRYVLYYDGTTGGDESIGIAGSLDGLYWVGHPSGLPILGAILGDNIMISRCSVILENGIYHMWYSTGYGNINQNISYAESNDSYTWVEAATNPIFSIYDGVVYRSVRTYTPSVLHVGNEYQMWFSCRAPGLTEAICYASYLLPTTTTTTTTTPTTTADTTASTLPLTTSPSGNAELSKTVALAVGLSTAGLFCILVVGFICAGCALCNTDDDDDDDDDTDTHHNKKLE